MNKGERVLLKRTHALLARLLCVVVAQPDHVSSAFHSVRLTLIIVRN